MSILEQYETIKRHGYLIDVREAGKFILIKGQTGRAFRSFDEALTFALNEINR